MYRSDAGSSPFIIFLELFLSVESRQFDTISLTEDLKGIRIGFLKYAEHDGLQPACITFFRTPSPIPSDD
jgi:hypothetical protein